mmetsp:Transcript_1995/g.2685  ORF Transcript_1995/g.2685 Transcript_1995/m.2685 type:complete len:135 (+) Transcript_1995:22-426(+)
MMMMMMMILQSRKLQDFVVRLNCGIKQFEHDEADLVAWCGQWFCVQQGWLDEETRSHVSRSRCTRSSTLNTTEWNGQQKQQRSSTQDHSTVRSDSVPNTKTSHGETVRAGRILFGCRATKLKSTFSIARHSGCM